MFCERVAPETDGGVGFAFTDRWGGVSDATIGPLNLGRPAFDAEGAVQENFRRVTGELGVPTVVAVHQVHGLEVLVVDDAFLERWTAEDPLGPVDAELALPTADAIVTTLPGVGLAVRGADCAPVLFADPEAGVVGACHAGRAGWLLGIVGRTVEAMRGLGAKNISGRIGPHICGRCYELPADLVEEVGRDHPWAVSRTSWGTPALDLGAGLAHQLEELGVRVDGVGPCTLERHDLHSYRRDVLAAGRLAGITWRVSEAGSRADAA